jgi:hypothetical protein
MHQGISLPLFPWQQEKQQPNKKFQCQKGKIMHIDQVMKITIPVCPFVGISQHKHLHPAQFCSTVAYLHPLCPLQMASQVCSKVQRWLHAKLLSIKERIYSK